MLFTRRDLTGLDLSQPLPRRLWRTFPSGLPLVTPSAVSDAAATAGWNPGALTDPFLFRATDGTTWLAFAAQAGDGVGVVQVSTCTKHTSSRLPSASPPPNTTPHPPPTNHPRK